MNTFNLRDVVTSKSEPGLWEVVGIEIDNFNPLLYKVKSLGPEYALYKYKHEEDLELTHGLETKPLRFLAAYRCSLYGDRYWHEETHQVPLRLINAGHANIVRYTKDNMYTERGRPIHMFVLND